MKGVIILAAGLMLTTSAVQAKSVTLAADPAGGSQLLAYDDRKSYCIKSTGVAYEDLRGDRKLHAYAGTYGPEGCTFSPMQGVETSNTAWQRVKDGTVVGNIHCDQGESTSTGDCKRVIGTINWPNQALSEDERAADCLATPTGISSQTLVEWIRCEF